MVKSEAPLFGPSVDDDRVHAVCNAGDNDDDGEHRSLASADRHFFRPLVPGFRDHMEIPKYFVKYIEGEKDRSKVVLRCHGFDRVWHVKIDSCWRFKDGWQDFATIFDLRVGDFLVFRHQGFLVFEVLIFDPSGCLREYPPSDANARISQKDQCTVKTKPRNRYSSMKGVAQKEPYCWIMVNRCFLESGRVNIRKAFAELSGLSRCREVMVKDQRQRSWPVKVNVKRCDGQVTLGRGSRKMKAANCFEKEDVVILKLVKDHKKPILELLRIPYGNRTSKGASIATLTHRHCFGFIEQQNLDEAYLRVPKAFARANHLNQGQYEMIVNDQNQRVWPALLKFPEDQLYFVSNWNEFTVTNALKPGDAYMLELTMTQRKFQVDFYCSSSQ